MDRTRPEEIELKIRRWTCSAKYSASDRWLLVLVLGGGVNCLLAKVKKWFDPNGLPPKDGLLKVYTSLSAYAAGLMQTKENMMKI